MSAWSVDYSGGVESASGLDARIRELFATLLQVDISVIDDRARPATIDRWDSLQHLILVSGFEEELGIDIAPEEAVEMYESFVAFREMIRRKMARQQ